jgi:hypothetical protein
LKSFARIFSFGLIFYLGMIFLGGFSTVNPDGVFRLMLTHSLVTEGSFLTTNGPINYAPLQSILMIPTYALGYYYGLINSVPPDKLFFYGNGACYLFYLPVIVSALLVLFFKILKEMGVDEDTGIISTFALFCSTFLLSYSKGMFADPLSALLILASFYCLLRAQSGSYLMFQRRNFFCLSLLILNNFIFILYSGLMLTYVLWGSGVRRRNPQEALRVVLEGLLILSAGVILFLGYNYVRFGEWFNFGYLGEGFTNNLIVGLYGLMFSFGHGLIVFAPITVLCIFYFTFRNQEMESGQRYLFATSMISFVCYLIVYAKWSSWHGGWCWGPRFLLPFVPLLHVMFPFLWKSVSKDNRVLGVGILLALVWGLGINLLNIADPRMANQMNDELPFLDRVFIPEKSFIFKIAGSEMSGSSVLSALMVLGACAFSLWVWRKVFNLKSFAPELSASEAS